MVKMTMTTTTTTMTTMMMMVMMMVITTKFIVNIKILWSASYLWVPYHRKHLSDIERFARGCSRQCSWCRQCRLRPASLLPLPVSSTFALLEVWRLWGWKRNSIKFFNRLLTNVYLLALGFAKYTVNLFSIFKEGLFIDWIYLKIWSEVERVKDYVRLFFWTNDFKMNARLKIFPRKVLTSANDDMEMRSG